MDQVLKICKKNKLFLIEDGSQSFGAKYKGKINGSFGVVSAISHNPMKVFSAVGEAGTVLTNSFKIKKRLEMLRYNGTVNKEICLESSLNARMDTVQAAILIYKLKYIKDIINKRKKNARYYSKHLKNIIDIPYEKNYEYDVYYTYTIKAKDRDKLKDYLFNKGIETKIHHPLLMPEQPFYKKGVKGEYKKMQKN